MCFGLVTSKAVLMSMLDKYIVGHITLPRLKHWSSVLVPLPVILQQICHHDLKVLATVPSIPPTCNFFQISSSFFFSRRRKRHDAYHFDMRSHNFRHMLRSCHVKQRPDVHATKHIVGLWSLKFLSSVLLSSCHSQCFWKSCVLIS